MDPAELLRLGAEGLKPLLPFLFEKVAEGFAQRAGETGFDKSLATVKAWWKKVLGLPEGQAVAQAAGKLEQKGDDPRRLQAFELVLGDALEQSPALLSELRELLPELRVLAQVVVQAGEGSTVVMPGGIGTFDKSTHLHLHPPAADSSAQALRISYLRWVLRENRSLPLEEFDFTAAGEQERSVPLAAVYTSLLAHRPEPELQEHGPRKDDGERSREQLPPTALELVNRFGRLVLLGEAGSGKTTLTSFLAACLAGEKLEDAQFNLEQLCRPVPGEDEARPNPWSQGAALPIRIELRELVAWAGKNDADLGAPASFWRFLSRQLEPEGLSAVVPVLEQEARTGGAVLLFDGLDEVPDADRCRAQLKNGIQRLADTLPPACRVVVTGRIYAYQQPEWRLRDFEQATLLRLKPAQIDFFVERWYEIPRYQRKFTPEGASRRATNLKAAARSRPELADLAQRPILLALMAGLHADRGELPEGRAQLYEDTVHLLLERWDKRHFLRDGKEEVAEPSVAEALKLPNREPIRRMLEELAFQGREGQAEAGSSIDLPLHEVRDRLMVLGQGHGVDPVKLLSYLEHRAGILVPRGNNLLSFPHPSLGEYLAASHLVRIDPKKLLARCARSTPDRWRDVVVLAAAKAKASVPFSFWAIVESLLDGEPQGVAEDQWGAHLAGMALAECLTAKELDELDSSDRAKLARVQARLLAVLEGHHLPPYERALVGRNLAALGDPRRHVMHLDEMQFCWVPPGPFLMGSAHDDSVADDNEKYPEGVSRELNLEQGYWMARFPLTVAQWRHYLGDANRQAGDADSEQGAGNEPVRWVSWEEATGLCAWLTEEWRRKGLLPKNWVVRLPTEAEWEKAARGGLKLPAEPTKPMTVQGLAAGGMAEATRSNPAEDRAYPWPGEDDPNRRNGDDSGINRPSAVGCFALGASPYGCEEISGNVWEWTSSRYLPYPFDPRRNAEEAEPHKEALRVVRGGSYFLGRALLRCAVRNWSHIGARVVRIGFRVVVVPPFTSGL